MTTRSLLDALRTGVHGRGREAIAPNGFDLLAFILIIGALTLIAHSAGEMRAPLSRLDVEPVRLDVWLLPGYALRTTLRMFAAMAASLVFTFVTATLAAKSRRAEMVIIPTLDILQSVPVLGFLTFTVLFFLNLFPGSQLGAECAAIFAIFTAQAWNMAFSFYQSLRTIPRDLEEVSRHFQFSAWLRFWRLEAPFATPGLVWNAMMSMSGSWFFVVASEAISVGDTKIVLPGIGAWLSIAIEQKNIGAVAIAVAAIAVVIVCYDQLVFRPIVAWADKFRVESTASLERPRSWVYDLLRRTRLIKRLGALLAQVFDFIPRFPRRRRPAVRKAAPAAERALDAAWLVLLAACCAYGAWTITAYVGESLSWGDVASALWLGALTLVRVLILIALASVMWVPIGVWIGLRPGISQRIQPVAQFLAAFPANVLFPFAVVAIVAFHGNPNIWLSPLMVLGTQWYILFNVIAGASAFPTDLREVATMYRLRPMQWWRRVMLPGIFPYYITGALTASGGSWNASIVAEVASWGDTKLEAAGLGAYIARATDDGDYHRVVLGVAVMSIYVILFNQALWRPLYRYAERHFRAN
jgi:NitT/TauT family transport system permease protein